MTELKDIKDMITELFNKLVKPKEEPKQRKISMGDYFIMCDVEEAL